MNIHIKEKLTFQRLSKANNSPIELTSHIRLFTNVFSLYSKFPIIALIQTNILITSKYLQLTHGKRWKDFTLVITRS